MENFDLISIHGSIALVALILGLVALCLGLIRIGIRFGWRWHFPRFWHMRFGGLALLLWLCTALVMGLGLTFLDSPTRTSPHTALALWFAILAGLGLMASLFFATHKRPRRWMSLLHGLINAVLVGLMIWEMRMGYELWESLKSVAELSLRS